MARKAKKTEKLKKKSVLKPVRGKNGGRRPGAGRKKGGENKKTREKRMMLEHYRQRVYAKIDSLINAQITLAEGCSYLYRIEKVENGKQIKQIKTLVTDPVEIEMYLNGDVEPGLYYYITTDKPDMKAISDMLDRGLDKATQGVEMTTDITSGGKTILDILTEIDSNEKK